MMFPSSNPLRALPANAAAWVRAADSTRNGHHTAWGDEVLVNVGASKLVTALPKTQYVKISGEQHLPLNVIVYLLGRHGALRWHELLALVCAVATKPGTASILR